VQNRRYICGLALAILSLFIFFSELFAQVPDPKLIWRTVNTVHFDVHYHEPLGQIAQRVAQVAESVNRALEKDFGAALGERTQIVISDSSAWANGSARVLPRNEIALFVAAPDDMSPFSDYDDWLTTLIAHEHTHVYHLNQIGGIPAIINAIFGKTYAPNSAQPTWFIEGLATYQESSKTSGGRLRSSMFDMYLRMDALENRLLRIDQLSNQANRWPHGDMAYLYGSRFVQFIESRYGIHALSAISREYGRQAIPYGINRISKRVTGFTFVDLYEQFLREISLYYQERQRQLTEYGLVEGKPLTLHGETSFFPRFLSDGRIVYFSADGRTRPQLRTTDGDAIVRVTGASNWSAHPNGRELVFSNTAPYRDIYNFYDLFAYDLITGHLRRLTTGMRARDPDISPNGRQIAYVIESSGTSHLALSELRDIERTRQVILRNPPYGQVSSPRWSPDGTRIAFSLWRSGGRRDIVAMDIASGRQTSITDDRAVDTGPAWSPDGQWLYFSSDRTGIANIYAHQFKTGLLYQVTNVIGGAYQPAISQDGSRLIYVGYHARGYDIYNFEIHVNRFRPALSPDGRRSPVESSRPPLLPDQPYNPLPTLVPRSYRLELAPDDFGYQLGISVANTDIVGHHYYSARVAMSLERYQPNLDLTYAYQRWPLNPTVTVYRHIGKRKDLIVADKPVTWTENAIGASVGASYNFPGDFYRESVGASYSLFRVNGEESVNVNLDPRDPPPEIPELGITPSVRLSWRVSTIERQTYDISPSRGQSLVLSVGAIDRVLGASYRAVAVRWTVTQFILMPWLSHHVLALRYAGGQASGDSGRPQSFSVGGFPASPELGSISELIYTGMIPALGGEALRGYRPHDRTGSQFHLLQTEYRFPLWRADLGPYTLPIYFRRVYATVLADYGDAFFEPFDLSTFRLGIGAEILSDFVIGYASELTLRLGIARGLSSGRVSQFYLHFGFPF
jgi:hypothetical protein